MSGYVDKDTVIFNVRLAMNTDGEIMNAICNAPTEDVAPVKRGRWKTVLRHEHWPSPDTFEADYCSVCGRRGSKEFLFCPNCGADMRGEKQ